MIRKIIENSMVEVESCHENETVKCIKYAKDESHFDPLIFYFP